MTTCSEQSGRPEEKRLDDQPLRFGKYKGMTPRQIAASDPSYITWLRANILPSPCTRELALECEATLDDVDVDEEEEDDE